MGIGKHYKSVLPAQSRLTINQHTKDHKLRTELGATAIQASIADWSQ